MHDSGCLGEKYAIGHPQCYVRAELHKTHEPRKIPSPWAKIPQSFFPDAELKFLVNSCTREYKDWTANSKDKLSPKEHFVQLSSPCVPFSYEPWKPLVLPDIVLGLAPMEDWPHQEGQVPWILDPSDFSKLAHSGTESAGARTTRESGKKKKKKKKKSKQIPTPQEPTQSSSHLRILRPKHNGNDADGKRIH